MLVHQGLCFENKPGHFVAHNFNSERPQSLGAAPIE
jgi:hypothetical protein